MNYPQRLVTDEERKAYGDDLLSVVERQALEAFSPELRRLQAANDNLRQRVARGEARTIYDNLDAALPNWREINTSSEFLNWLAVPDQYSGQVKAGMLREAFSSGDAGRVLAFFAGFLAEHQQPGSNRMQYQRDQAPRRQEPNVITNKDIDRHFERVRQGYYRDDQQKDAEERRIHNAVREGRVRRVP